MKKIFTFIISLVLGLSVLAQPVFADAQSGSGSNCVDTAILDGCSTPKDILIDVVNIMTVGVGVLATIGLGVAGIQYLTAGGSEEKTRKAKRRILEIVIGLLAYVLIYAFLQFILPNFEVPSGS